MGGNWYDPIFDAIVEVKDLSWSEFFQSKYFWLTVGTVISIGVVYYNLESIKKRYE